MLRVPSPHHYPRTPLTVSPAVRDTLEHLLPIVCQTSPCRSQRKVTARDASPQLVATVANGVSLHHPGPLAPSGATAAPRRTRSSAVAAAPPGGSLRTIPPPDASPTHTREARPATPSVPWPRASSLPRHRRLGRGLWRPWHAFPCPYPDLSNEIRLQYERMR